MKFEKLGEIVKITKGKKHEPVPKREGRNFRYIQIDDLRNDNNLKYTDEKGTEVNENDLIIAWDGANAGTIGFGKTGMIGSTLARLRIKEEKEYNTDFIGYLLRSQNKFLRSKTTGATIPHISKDALESILVPQLDYPEQYHASLVLKKSEAVIEQRKQSIELLDELIKSSFNEMFGNPQRNEKGWNTKPLGELCLMRRGASPRPINDFIGDAVPWIKIGDGTKGNELYIESTAVSITKAGAEKSVLLNEGSLVFANCGVSLGFARILKIKGCIHDGWLSFEKVSSELDKIFLLKLLNHSTNYLRRIAPDGTQPNLNTGIMKKFEIILPPIELQIHFAKIVSNAEALREQYKKSLIELENLYGSLSQKAFKGELEFSKSITA